MNDIFVGWQNTYVSISCNIPFNLDQYIKPYYQLYRQPLGIVTKFLKIVVAHEEHIEWSEKNSTLTFYITMLNEKAYSAILVLLNLLIKHELQEKQIYILHASSVIANGCLILLFGSSGSGKTIAALNLALNHHCKFVSNGSTAILYERGNLARAIGTYKTGIKIRKSTLDQFNHTMSTALFPYQSQKNAFDQKRVFMPEELGIIPADEWELSKVSKIKFYIIQLSNDQIGPDVMHRVDYDYKVSMQLYEDLSREINGSEVYIDLGNGSLFVPSLDNSNLCESRIRFVNEFMEQHYRGIFMGKLHAVCNGLLHETVDSECV